MLYSEHMTEDGPAMFNAAARLNWEGIISKRADAPTLPEDQDQPTREIPDRRFHSGSRRHRGALPGQARGQGAALCGQGRDSLAN
jgi:hypothetical protein